MKKFNSEQETVFETLRNDLCAYLYKTYPGKQFVEDIVDETIVQVMDIIDFDRPYAMIKAFVQKKVSWNVRNPYTIANFIGKKINDTDTLDMVEDYSQVVSDNIVYRADYENIEFMCDMEEIGQCLTGRAHEVFMKIVEYCAISGSVADKNTHLSDYVKNALGMSTQNYSNNIVLIRKKLAESGVSI